MMTRRTFGQAMAALGVAAALPVHAVARKLDAAFYDQDQGLYAAVAFSQQMLTRHRGHSPWMGVPLNEARTIIQRHGVYDEQHDLWWVKHSAFRDPQDDRWSRIGPPLRITGGTLPMFAATAVVFYEKGQMLEVRKWMLERPDNELGLPIVARHTVPVQISRTATRTLEAYNGILGGGTPEVYAV